MIHSSFTKIAVTFLLFTGVIARAQVPQTLSYQGLLTDATGSPVANAAYNVTFNFYTVLTGGTVVQSRTINGINTFQGLFTTIIGNGQGGSANTPLNNLTPAFGSTQYYIGLQVNNGTELSPRVALTAVPYAFAALSLDASFQLPPSQLATGIDASKITTGTLPAAQIGAGTIDNTKLATGISAAKITTGTLPTSVIPATVGVPVGTIIAYGGATIPTGWLSCDGSAISRTANSTLYTAIGVTWGGGDGTTTFNLPDLRGIFLRGVDGTAGNDPDKTARTAKFTLGASGNNVGSYQTDRMADHTHGETTNATPGVWPWSGGNGLVYGNGVASVIANNYLQTSTQNQTGNETRPKNAYVIYIIKAQ